MTGNNFLAGLKGATIGVAKPAETPTTDVAALSTEAVPAPTTTMASALQAEETSPLSDRPDLAQAHEALNNLLGNVAVGMQNSQTAIPAPAFLKNNPFGVVEDGMKKPGYYSSAKGRVKGVVAEQVGGRFFFPLTVSEDMLEELESLVKAGVYEKVEASE